MTRSKVYLIKNIFTHVRKIIQLSIPRRILNILVNVFKEFLSKLKNIFKLKFNMYNLCCLFFRNSHLLTKTNLRTPVT